MGRYVIYSKSERGFWNNDLGWVLDLEDATAFTDQQMRTFAVPMASGQDAIWKALGDAREGFICEECGDFVTDLEGSDSLCGNCADRAAVVAHSKEVLACAPVRIAARRAIEATHAWLKAVQALREVVGTRTELDPPDHGDLADALEQLVAGSSDEGVTEAQVDALLANAVLSS